jgi:hypothetical protein
LRRDAARGVWESRTADPFFRRMEGTPAPDRIPGMPGPLSRLLRRRPRPTWLAREQCGGAFVCPMERETADDDHWLITCRCGACGAWYETLLTNAQAASWDVELDRQAELIDRAARRLDHERMTTQAEAFAAALRCDLIDAADFAY